MSNNTLIKVDGSTLARDKVSKAILNTNERERQLYLERRAAALSKDKRLEFLEQRVLNLEAELEIIKKLINK